MLFFDFLYYRISRFYESFGEKGSEASGAFLIGGLMSMNVFLAVFLINFFTESDRKVNTLLIVGVTIALMAFNYVRYVWHSNNSVDVIERKWLKKSVSSRNLMTLFHIIYGVGSVVGFFGFAIYVGSQR